MTIDDESLLSAYMDGQLSPEQQQLAESAVVADPRLGEELRKLSLVRDLVAGLSREVPVDVSARVRQRIRARSPLRRIWPGLPLHPFGRLHPARAAGMMGLAALLLVGLLLTFLQSLQTPALGPMALTGPTVAVLEESVRPSVSSVLLKASESRWPSFPHTTSEGAASKAETHVRHADDRGQSERESDELEHVSQYLDNPDLRRIFLVADVMDGSAQKQVAHVVEETTRFNFFKITIAQGVVIDPRHPGEATVFALVVSPGELETLRGRLRKELRDPVEETPADPSVVTQLADIGQVQACPPSAAAEVEIPRVAVAFRAPGQGGDEEPGPAVDQPAPDRPPTPTPEQERSSPAASLQRESPAGRDEQKCIVLVWVSRPRPR
jgi:hypothetical protein